MNRSKLLYEKSIKITPGGVSSPVRAFKPNPIYIKSANGCYITDVDGRRYLDMCMAYGPLITGHVHPDVFAAVKNQMSMGTVYGAPSEIELLLIEKIVKEIPSADMVRLTCSGTEATMHAIRLARGFTNKDDIIKMNGGFHGSHDSVLINMEGAPYSNGIPEDITKHTIIAEYNNVEHIANILNKNKNIACVIMEPILGNVGVVTPNKQYLNDIRKITSENDVLLIFDEVITGFRVSSGGAQKIYGVTPDLTTMAKIIGGGFAAGAFAGRRDIMENVSPQGNVYVAGTFAGNPISAAAGLAQIDIMCKNDNYRKINEKTNDLVSCISDMMIDRKINGCINHSTSMFSIFFGRSSVNNGQEAYGADRVTFDKMFRYMLSHGIYMAPSPLEVSFMSIAHNDDAIAKFENTFDGFLGEIKHEDRNQKKQIGHETN